MCIPLHPYPRLWKELICSEEKAYVWYKMVSNKGSLITNCVVISTGAYSLGMMKFFLLLNFSGHICLKILTFLILRLLNFWRLHCFIVLKHQFYSYYKIPDNSFEDFPTLFTYEIDTFQNLKEILIFFSWIKKIHFSLPSLFFSISTCGTFIGLRSLSLNIVILWSILRNF